MLYEVITGLVFVFGLQLCNQIGSEQKSHPAVKEVLYNGDDSATASFEELYSQNEVDRPKGELNTLLIMTGLVLLVFVATVITSYSIHYTKLYEERTRLGDRCCRLLRPLPLLQPFRPATR